jgi:hypothetical protein
LTFTRTRSRPRAARDLGEPIGSLGDSQIEILSAIDFLFFGI